MRAMSDLPDVLPPEPLALMGDWIKYAREHSGLASPYSRISNPAVVRD